MKFIKDHLILILGLVGIFIFFSTMALDLSRESTGMQGVLFWISRLAGMIVILPSQMLILFNDGELIPFHRTLSIGLGLGFCMLLDIIKNKIRRQNGLRR